MKRWISLVEKILLNGGLFILIAFFTYKMVFSKMDFRSLPKLVENMNWAYLFCGLASAMFLILAEAYCIQRNLRLLGQKPTYVQCLTYSYAGNFFSGITPAGVGGQPMQLYYVHKDNIPPSTGMLAMLMDLGSYQVSIVALAVIGYLMYFNSINSALGSLLPILLVGIVVNCLLATITFTAMFSKNFIFKLVSFATKIVGVFTKDKGSKFKEKAIAGVNRYKASAEVLKKNKASYAVNITITFFRVVAMHSAPFWIYKSFGLSGDSIFRLLAIQSALYISCAALPLPGGVGIGESIFLVYFKGIFTDKVIGSAMVISRIVGFYFIIAFCGLGLVIITISRKLKRANGRKQVG